MRKKLNGGALVLDSELLAQVGISQDAEVDVSANGGVITVTPLRDLDELLDEMDEQYGSVFKRLAE